MKRRVIQMQNKMFLLKQRHCVNPHENKQCVGGSLGEHRSVYQERTCKKDSSVSAARIEKIALFHSH